ncbi:MAG: hypothetical protein GY715_18915 [Planctomycetes bacterium]|nr:hypothetical protein [Planctomycetota bacterium]
MNRERIIWSVILLIAIVYVGYRVANGGMGLGYEQRINGTVAPGSSWDVLAGSAEVSLSRTIGVWVAALFTLFVLSFVYRDNPFYKVAESIFIGVSAAYWMVVGFWTTVVPNLFGKLFPGMIHAWAMPGLSPEHEPFWWLYFVPLILGGMLLWRLAPAGTWIARWPLAFIIGTTAGIRLVGFIHADFLSQIRNSIIPLLTLDDAGAFSFWGSLRNFFIILGVLSCLVYFFFSFEHKGFVGRTAKLGVWFLMVTFGAAFGYTVMGRIALLAIRLEFLFDDWLWLIDPTNKRVEELVAMVIPLLSSTGLT